MHYKTFINDVLASITLSQFELGAFVAVYVFANELSEIAKHTKAARASGFKSTFNITVSLSLWNFVDWLVRFPWCANSARRSSRWQREIHGVCKAYEQTIYSEIGQEQWLFHWTPQLSCEVTYWDLTFDIHSWTIHTKWLFWKLNNLMRLVYFGVHLYLCFNKHRGFEFYLRVMGGPQERIMLAMHIE